MAEVRLIPWKQGAFVLALAFQKIEFVTDSNQTSRYDLSADIDYVGDRNRL
jgi:hypothetical protein